MEKVAKIVLIDKEDKVLILKRAKKFIIEAYPSLAQAIRIAPVVAVPAALQEEQ